MINYIIYARKSTDVEDKQVRSIEDQLAELRDFAKRERLKVVSELVEKRSAKIPGRPIFGDMVKRIERDGSIGILAWHPDRLARNSVDGGRIIYLVDTGRIVAMRFPTFWFEPTPQGKFMLNIAFGQSKYYVDSLAENTRRGLLQKAKRGEYPGFAPIGYLNNPRKKSVVIDPEKAKIVQELFEQFAVGDMRLEDGANLLKERGVVSKGGKIYHLSRVSFVLTNPFYCGMFKYAKELFEGKHKPIVSKALFDRVQDVVHERWKPRKSPKNNPLPFCGLLHCATCGCGVTGDEKWKYQKNGNVHHYIYYHCIKRSRFIKCPEPGIRSEKLDRQLSGMLRRFSLKENWTKKLMVLLDTDRKETVESYLTFCQALRTRINILNEKLKILLDSHLDHAIDRDTYTKKKAQLLLDKKTLDEKLAIVKKNRNEWTASAEQWMKEAENLPAIANGTDLFLKKVAAKKIFGSSLVLSNQHIRFKTNRETKKLEDAMFSGSEEFLRKSDRSSSDDDHRGNLI